jgi:thiol-disulfide isomerase/thioredoxin
MIMQLRMLAAALKVTLATVLLVGSAHAADKLKVGDLPPDRLGKATSGEAIRLSAYRGQIVIVSFWASWCGPCRKELPMLVGLQKAAKTNTLTVVSVNWRESAEQFRQIRKALKDTLESGALTLVSDTSGAIGSRYGVQAIPHMVVIGRDGRIAAIHIGYAEDALPGLIDEINALWTQTDP